MNILLCDHIKKWQKHAGKLFYAYFGSLYSFLKQSCVIYFPSTAAVNQPTAPEGERKDPDRMGRTETHPKMALASAGNCLCSRALFLTAGKSLSAERVTVQQREGLATKVTSVCLCLKMHA